MDRTKFVSAITILMTIIEMMKTVEKKDGDFVTKEQIIAELRMCDFDTYVKALNLAYGQSMAANDVFFVGELDDEAFFQTILKYMSKSSFGAMNLMDIVRGLSTGDSLVDTKHKYVIFTPSLDAGSFQSYEDLHDLKNSCDWELLADLLLEDQKYKEVFPNL